MKLRLLLSLCVVALLGLSSFAQDANTKTKVQGKPYIQSEYPPLRTGGETMASAVVIDELPFADGGTTCGAADDYAANCGCCGGSSGAPDLVYAYTPEHTGTINIDLIGNYDVLVHVRDAAGNVIACDDDGAGIQHAIIYNFPVVGHETYYIVAEGYSSYCGEYTLSVAFGAPGEVPIAGWAVGIAIFLIASVAVVRYIKLS